MIQHILSISRVTMENTLVKTLSKKEVWAKKRVSVGVSRSCPTQLPFLTTHSHEPSQNVKHFKVLFPRQTMCLTVPVLYTHINIFSVLPPVTVPILNSAKRAAAQIFLSLTVMVATLKLVSGYIYILRSGDVLTVHMAAVLHSMLMGNCSG